MALQTHPKLSFEIVIVSNVVVVLVNSYEEQLLIEGGITGDECGITYKKFTNPSKKQKPVEIA